MARGGEVIRTNGSKHNLLDEKDSHEPSLPWPSNTSDTASGNQEMIIVRG